MVSRKQSVLTASLLLGTAFAAGASDKKKDAAAKREAGAHAASSDPSVVSRPKFRSDDPLWVEPKPLPVRDVKTIEIGDLYDFVEQSFVTPHQLKHAERVPAQNVNTVGETPDSEWYTNRHALHPMTIDELMRGAGNANPPDPDGAWKVISAKSDGVMPGFRIEDGHGNHYLLKFDPPDFPELSSSADVIGSKIYYALGYNTPENYAVYFRREQLTIAEKSSWRDRVGKEHALTAKQIDEWLADQPRDSQGRYRAMASRWIEGKPIGPFNMEETRSDDPNDVVPHENRRELRGMCVFAAWLNDTDAKSINTLDSLVTKNGVPYVEHFRIDWGAALGSDSLKPKDIRRGHDYIISPKTDALQAASFGLYLPKWMRVHYPKIRGTGTFDYESFDPVKWRSNYPVTAFMMMDEDDAFWAAKKVMAFSDAELRALVQTGGFTDPRAVDWVTECLIKRRDKVGHAWLASRLALDNFRVENGALAFDDLAAKYHLRDSFPYSAQWASFNNATGATTAVDAHDWKLPDAGADGYLLATIRATGSDAALALGEVKVYLRRTAQGWIVVGVEWRAAA